MPKENGRINPQKHKPKGKKPVGDEGKDKKNTEKKIFQKHCC